MVKAIISAIVSALRSLGRIAGRIATAPLRAINRILGVDDGSDPGDAPDVARYTGDDEAPATGPDLDAVYRELANIVMAWAANSIVSGQPAPLPPKMPRDLSAWLPGISLDETHVLINADEMAVSSHLRSRELIRGVRSVRPLEAAVWPEEPDLAFDQGSPGCFLSAAGYSPAR
jgi:hypothetical protein